MIIPFLAKITKSILKVDGCCWQSLECWAQGPDLMISELQQQQQSEQRLSGEQPKYKYKSSHKWLTVVQIDELETTPCFIVENL